MLLTGVNIFSFEHSDNHLYVSHEIRTHKIEMSQSHISHHPDRQQSLSGNVQNQCHESNLSG